MMIVSSSINRHISRLTSGRSFVALFMSSMVNPENFSFTSLKANKKTVLKLSLNVGPSQQAEESGLAVS